ncbi:MAG: DUF3168 domain-containing protein, partial [Aliifodinibius sp.]|nr:DUF3168 domain-containing protein [Fodinibius sp.]NIV11891.1 DUF3168 domain-containing protein [Fodinibius sp.]NIY25536.1 DUF3168 domain-containing protein [Fodinibius sp.]
SGFSSLTTLVGDHIYPQKIPQGINPPTVAYYRVSGYRVNDLQGYSGLENPRIQVDIISTGLDQRRQIADQVIDAMASSTTFKAVLISSPIDEWDDNTELYQRILQFSVWNDE